MPTGSSTSQVCQELQELRRQCTRTGARSLALSKVFQNIALMSSSVAEELHGVAAWAVVRPADFVGGLDPTSGYAVAAQCSSWQMLTWSNTGTFADEAIRRGVCEDPLIRIFEQQMALVFAATTRRHHGQ